MFKRRPTGEAASGRVQTVIGEGVVLSGTIESSGTIRIDGRLQGRLRHNGTVVVGPTGRLEADVVATCMVVAGEVRGNVEIEERLELLATGRLVGDLQCGHLVVQEGAVFAGTSAMTGDAAAENPGPPQLSHPPNSSDPPGRSPIVSGTP